MRSRRHWFDLHDDSQDAPDVAVLGLPYDGSVSRQAGAAAGPARVRELSRTSDPITRRGREVSGVTLRDYGDVPVADGSGSALSQNEFFAAAAARLGELPDASFPLALGGDNSVSIPVIQEFARRHGNGAGVVWFDAHPDLFEAYDGNPDSHASALRRGMELGGLAPGQAVLVGTRSFAQEEVRYIRDQGIELVTAADWAAGNAAGVADRVAARLQGLSAIYLAVDIDVLDASCAPGTGYPMPGGVGSEAFFVLLEELFARLPVRAMDLTEIAPPLDTNDVTAFLGAQIVLETLGLLAGRAG